MTIPENLIVPTFVVAFSAWHSVNIPLYVATLRDKIFP
jgi:hypothetical protein